MTPLKTFLFVSAVLLTVFTTALFSQTTNRPSVRSLTTPYSPPRPILVDTNGNITFPTGDIAFPANVGIPGDVALIGKLASGESLKAPTFFVGTNAIASWPTTPASRGGCAILNSNGTVYILTSLPGQLTWAATNKLAP